MAVVVSKENFSCQYHCQFASIQANYLIYLGIHERAPKDIPQAGEKYQWLVWGQDGDGKKF